MKILLGQLSANGDCLYATILARQLKKDFPHCELTWAILSQCRHILKENPYIDNTWEFQVDSTGSRETAWWALEEAVLRKQTGPEPFDRIVLSQISPSNFRNYDGTIRPSILRAYQNPISVPIDSVVHLSDAEKEKVDNFVSSHGIDQFHHRILFECSSTSGQSYVTPSFVLEVADLVNQQLEDCCFILSTHEDIKCEMANIFSARELEMRENAALTHYCTLFTGCGSGLTVIATSTASKELPNIQLLTGRTSVFASFFHDFTYYGKSTDRFIEMADAPATRVADAIIACCHDGLDKAKTLYHQPLPVTFDFYCELIDLCLLQKGKYLDALESMAITVARYGWHEQLAFYGKKKILPYLHLDKLLADPDSRQQSEATLATLVQYDPTFRRSQ